MATKTDDKRAPLIDSKLARSDSDASLGRAASINVDEAGGDAAIIEVPSDFEPEEGMILADKYKVGKEIGGGAVGAVHELFTPDGKDSGKLLKVLKGKNTVPFTGADVGLKREWLIGQQLNKLASKKGGEIPGFMGTGEALVSDGRDTAGTGGVLQGLVLDKLNGWTVSKRLEADKEFENADYLLEMLRQVLKALVTAKERLGFQHNDMRISNVMEHHKDAMALPTKGFASSQQKKEYKKLMKDPKAFKLPENNKSAQLHFKIIDYGHAELSNKHTRRLPGVPFVDKIYLAVFKEKGDVWRLLQSLSDPLDGRTWPEDQQDKVEVLLKLIRNVTGIKLHAFFKARRDAGNGDVGDKGNAKASGTKKKRYRKGFPWQRKNGFLHKLRRFFIRLKAFFFPRNTNYTAKDALDFLMQHAPVQTSDDVKLEEK